MPTPTEKQGQHLAPIHTYELLNGRPPAEADTRAFFRVTSPTVHNMIVELERKGLITRRPREARSIAVCVPEDDIPRLRRQPIVSSVSPPLAASSLPRSSPAASAKTCSTD